LSVRSGAFLLAIDLPSDEARSWPAGADVGIAFLSDRVLLDTPGSAHPAAEEE
jgi:hypothetical protein